MIDTPLSAWLRDHQIAPAITAEPDVAKPRQAIEHDVFFQVAGALLRVSYRELQPLLAEELNSLPGRWHPSGYMIFILGEHPALGRLRLHVWPSGSRLAEPRPEGLQRDIHDHRTHISSIVLSGSYSDQFYAADVVAHGLKEDELVRQGLHAVFVPQRGRAASRSMVPTGECVLARPLQARDVGIGETHTIKAGEFHVPTIGLQEHAVTLVFTSQVVLDEGPRVLVAGTPDAITGSVAGVTASDRDRAAAYLTSPERASFD